MTAYLQERQYTTASLQEMAIYETAFLREGLYTTASLQEAAIYETASLQEGAVCEPRGARNLDAVVGERRDLLHARHHHILHLIVSAPLDKVVVHLMWGPIFIY